MARNISQLVDEQIRRWYLEQKAKPEEKKGPFEAPRVVTVSNAFGSNGIAVAQKVREMLDIPVYDREIVEHIATSTKVRVEAVESLDERALGAVDNYLINLFRERNFDQGDYTQALTRTITSLWAHGACVFVGRGAAHIISRRYCLAVRTVAPRKHRIRRAQTILGADRHHAEAELDRIDAEREHFIRRFFRVGIDEPLSYDLVVNMAGLTTTAAATLVVAAFEQKFPKA